MKKKLEWLWRDGRAFSSMQLPGSIQLSLTYLMSVFQFSTIYINKALPYPATPERNLLLISLFTPNSSLRWHRRRRARDIFFRHHTFVAVAWLWKREKTPFFATLDVHHKRVRWSVSKIVRTFKSYTRQENSNRCEWSREDLEYYALSVICDTDEGSDLWLWKRGEAWVMKGVRSYTRKCYEKPTSIGKAFCVCSTYSIVWILRNVFKGFSSPLGLYDTSLRKGITPAERNPIFWNDLKVTEDEVVREASVAEDEVVREAKAAEDVGEECDWMQ